MTIPLITGYLDPSSVTGVLNQLISQVNGVASSLPAASITIPTGAMGIYSAVAVNGYAGPCIRVQRSSDNAQMDIPFSNGVADWVSADGFAAGAYLQIQIMYDQSGNKNNLVAANTNPPSFVPGGNFRGIRPFGYFSTSPGASQNMIAPVAMNSNSFTVYQIINSYTQGYASAWFSFQDTPANGAEPIVLYLPAGTPFAPQLTSPGNSGSLGFVPPSQYIAASFSGNGSCNVNGVVTALGQATSSKLGQFCLGGSNLVSPYWLNGGIFFTAVYPTNHSAAQQVTINNAALSPFYDPTIKNKQITYGGSSLNSGYHSTYGYDPAHQAGFGRSSLDDSLGLYALPAMPDWRYRNFGIPGQTVATEIANAPASFVNAAGVLPAGFIKNIYVLGDASNDINASGGYASTAAAQAAMNTLWTSSVLPFIVALNTAGFTGVVVSTIIPRTGFNLASGNYYEDARLQYNANIRTGVVGGGYVVADRAAPGPFSTQTSYTNATYYSPDGIHCTNLGYGILGNVCKTAILSI